MSNHLSEKQDGIWKEPGFLVLASGQIVSQFGDNLLAIVLMWMAGSPKEPRYVLPIVSFIRFLPVLFGVMAGVFADRWDHRRTLMTTDTIRFGLIAVVVIFLMQGASIWWILLVVGMVQIVGSIYGPSMSAFIPEVVAQHNLVAAEGFVQSSYNLAQMTGVLVGGALLAIIGMPTLVAGDAASFLVAAVSLYAIPARGPFLTDPRHITSSLKAPVAHPLLQYFKNYPRDFISYTVPRSCYGS